MSKRDSSKTEAVAFLYPNLRSDVPPHWPYVSHMKQVTSSIPYSGKGILHGYQEEGLTTTVKLLTTVKKVFSEDIEDKRLSGYDLHLALAKPLNECLSVAFILIQAVFNTAQSAAC